MPDPSPRKRFLWGLFDRPELPILTVFFLALGVGIGLYFLPDDWSLGTRVFGGAALGMAAVLSFFANRMIGGQDFD